MTACWSSAPSARSGCPSLSWPQGWTGGPATPGSYGRSRSPSSSGWPRCVSAAVSPQRGCITSPSSYRWGGIAGLPALVTGASSGIGHATARPGASCEGASGPWSAEVRTGSPTSPQKHRCRWSDPGTHSAVPHLVKAAADALRQVADIVNIGSLAGREAFAMSAVYCATKFGVGAFSESLRQELARRHVRVSVVQSGSVDTASTPLTRAEPIVRVCLVLAPPSSSSAPCCT
ncbi:SDR family NAD(P)-dependent oxidoreductase [Streptomyces sp. NPDC052101]|uniref:SDR family NAD(P)-dependent oxidoreductase n=1 Tax=Streptomyces sp. NPDC052101 TaxID=3155763 RepID=UPI003446D8A5